MADRLNDKFAYLPIAELLICLFVNRWFTYLLICQLLICFFAIEILYTVPEIYGKSDYRQPVESDLLTFTNSILVNSVFFQEYCWSMNLVAVMPTQIYVYN
jgi:hypothetical protein